MASGVYQISIQADWNNGDEVTLLRYIGQSIDIGRRWDWHEDCLNRGVHHNRVLQMFWQTGHSFSWETIEVCPIEELFDRERHHIEEAMKKNECINSHAIGRQSFHHLTLGPRIRA